MKHICNVKGAYSAPELEVCSIDVEKGYSASVNSGIIEDAKTEDWGTL